MPRGRLALLLAFWIAARLLYLLGAGVEGLGNISFDEAQYLQESFLLARGAASVFYKGPFLYLITSAFFLISPTLLAAKAVSLLLDACLVAGFYLAVKPHDEEAAWSGSLLIAACPLSAYFAFHLLTDVPLALFAFLCVHAYCRPARPGGDRSSSGWLALSLLVKSTALVLFPILLACTPRTRAAAWRLARVAAPPALMYLVLVLVWPQTPDAHFVRALPWMSFNCGLFYFPVGILIAAGPLLVAACPAAMPGRGLLRVPAIRGAACALAVLYGAFTLFGDPQPKYIITFVPFLALLAGSVLAPLSSRRPVIVLALVSLAAVVPVARLMEADRGMTAIAAWLGRLPSPSIVTTIPDGVHQDAFAGSLRFVAGARLQYATPAEIALKAASGQGIAVWSDREGDPQALESHLAARGILFDRIDFFTNKLDRPVYLINMDRPAGPLRTRWEPNILTDRLETPLDRGLQRLKRYVNRLLTP